MIDEKITAGDAVRMYKTISNLTDADCAKMLQQIGYECLLYFFPIIKKMNAEGRRAAAEFVEEQEKKNEQAE